MWLEYLSNKPFGSIKTAVFYPHYSQDGLEKQYLPIDCFEDSKLSGTLKSLFKSAAVKKIYNSGFRPCYKSYLGSIENGGPETLLIYNFKRTSNSELLDPLMIEELDKETKSLINSAGVLDVEELAKIEQCIFPTCIEDSSKDKTKYFKSSKKDGNQIYFIPVPRYEFGCDTIELYDSILGVDYNSPEYIARRYVLEEKNPIEPVAIIHLGPHYGVSNNLSGRYWMFDPRGAWFLEDNTRKTEYEYEYNKYYIPRKNNTLAELDYLKQLDEYVSGGLLIVSVGSDGVVNLNLSESSWLQDSNPNRDQYKVSLTKKEYQSTKNIPGPVKEYGNNIISRLSGNILGSKLSQETPILAKKRARLRKIGESGVRDYFYGKTYQMGEVVTHSGQIWVSISNNNTKEIPGYSNKWALHDIVLKYLSSGSAVIPIKKETGEVLTDGVVVYPNNQIEIIGGKASGIKLLCDPEYDIDATNLEGTFSVYNPKLSEEIALGTGDFEYDTTRGTLRLGSNVNMEGNELRVKVIESKKIYSIYAIYNDRRYEYSEWWKIFGESFKAITNIGSGKDIDAKENNPQNIQFRRTKRISVDGLLKLYGDTREYSTQHKDYLEEVYYPLEVELGLEFSLGDFIDDTNLATNYPETSFCICLSDKTISVSVDGSSEFEVSDYYKRVPMGESTTISVYPLRSDTKYRIRVLKFDGEVLQEDTEERQGTTSYLIPGELTDSSLILNIIKV